MIIFGNILLVICTLNLIAVIAKDTKPSIRLGSFVLYAAILTYVAFR